MNPNVSGIKVTETGGTLQLSTVTSNVMGNKHYILELLMGWNAHTTWKTCISNQSSLARRSQYVNIPFPSLSNFLKNSYMAQNIRNIRHMW